MCCTPLRGTWLLATRTEATSLISNWNWVEGFESPFGLELLATVHWVAKEREAAAGKDIASLVYAWSDRKKMFTRRQIALAQDILVQKEWLSDVRDSEN